MAAEERVFANSDANGMLNNRNQAIGATVDKFLLSQSHPKSKSLQNIASNERRRVHPKLELDNYPLHQKSFTNRPEKYYSIVTEDPEFPGSTLRSQRMPSPVTSLSTQDVRSTRYRKSGTRNKRGFPPVQGPSTSESRHFANHLPPEPNADYRPDIHFSRADTKRSTIKKVRNLVRRWMGLEIKDRPPQKAANRVAELQYQPPRTYGPPPERDEPQQNLRRESSLRSSMRSPMRGSTRIRSSSSGSQAVRRPNVGDDAVLDARRQQALADSSTLHRNNSLTSTQRSRRGRPVQDEVQPVIGHEASSRLEGRLMNGYNQQRPSRFSNKVYPEDPESGLDSPTDSLKFQPSMPCMRGLPNLGNTCYMNSILHCLSAADPLAEYFVTSAFLKDLKIKVNSREAIDSVALAFKRILETLWCNDPSEQCVRDFRSVIAVYNEVYATNFQQDAQELLDWLLDKLHEELNPPSTWDAPEVPERSESPAFSIRRKVHRSEITNIFSASFRSSIECVRCGFKAVNFDPFICVSLQVPEQETPVFVTLSEALSKKKLTCFGMKVKAGGRIFDVKDCIRREFRVLRNLLAVMQLDDYGFTFLPSNTSIISLSTTDLFALEVPATPPDEITIIFTVVDSANQGEFERETGVRITEPMFCSVPRHASYDFICRALFGAIARHRSANVESRLPDPASCKLIAFDKWRTTSSLDPCVSMPLYTQAVDESLLELRDVTSESALVLQLLLKTSDPVFLRYLKNERRVVDYHSSFRHLKDLGTSTTLTDCLKEYTRPEHLQWTCCMCGNNSGEKIMKFHSLPDVLVFHMKRFKRLEDGTMVKIARKIDFPVSGLDMTPFVYQKPNEPVATGHPRFNGAIGVPVYPGVMPSRQSRAPALGDAIFVDTNAVNPHVYDLFAIVHHMGTSIDSGHYTATTKNPMDGKWRYYDDMLVRDVNSPIETETSTVYLLFYEKRTGKRTLNCSSSGHSSTESGIQDHWFNRKTIDLTERRNKWNGSRTGLQDDTINTRSVTSKEGSPVTGFRRNEITRSAHSPAYYASRMPTPRSRENLNRPNNVGSETARC